MNVNFQKQQPLGEIVYRTDLSTCFDSIMLLACFCFSNNHQTCLKLKNYFHFFSWLVHKETLNDLNRCACIQLRIKAYFFFLQQNAISERYGITRQRSSSLIFFDVNAATFLAKKNLIIYKECTFKNPL